MDEYCDAVMAYSRQLKSVAEQRIEAIEEMGRIRTGFLPRLSAAGSFAIAARKFDGTERWTFGVEPQIVQTIYGGGATRAAYRQAELGYGIALCNEEFTRFEVRYAAEYAYWNLSAMQLFAEAMQRYVS
ncbi:MAG: TolC family protein, partial [Alistipes sp.]|nr:TolC family protein [Alistipes sp.]